MKKRFDKSLRLAYLVSHPIQYQTPLLRKIAQDSRFIFKVFFRSDFSTREFSDANFGRKIEWDTRLLDGYNYEFLKVLGQSDRFSFWRPWNFGLLKGLRNHRIQILWVHGYASCYHLYAMLIAKILGIKVLIRDEATLISKKRSEFRNFIKKIFFTFITLLCDGFLAIGKMNKEYYLANGVSEKKIFEMPYAVDNDFFRKKVKLSRLGRKNFRISLNLSPERPVILYVGKLSESKRPMDLLEAYIYAVKNLKTRPYLLFIGDGKMRNQMENKVFQTGLEGEVFFMGFKNQNELPLFYDICNLFVLPSVFEPWGLVVNEAMNAGRAIIVSDHAGCSSNLISPGVNGFLFKAGDVCDLAMVLSEAISDPNRCVLMGKESLKIIKEWGFKQDIEALSRAAYAVLNHNHISLR